VVEDDEAEETAEEGDVIPDMEEVVVADDELEEVVVVEVEGGLVAR
jgi:hypothetical protein